MLRNIYGVHSASGVVSHEAVWFCAHLLSCAQSTVGNSTGCLASIPKCVLARVPCHLLCCIPHLAYRWMVAVEDRSVVKAFISSDSLHHLVRMGLNVSSISMCVAAHHSTLVGCVVPLHLATTSTPAVSDPTSDLFRTLT